MQSPDSLPSDEVCSNTKPESEIESTVQGYLAHKKPRLYIVLL